MKGIQRVEVEGHQADRRKRGGNFARHDSAFAYSRDHQLGFAVGTTLQQPKRSLHVLATEACRSIGNRCRLFLQAACECGQAVQAQMHPLLCMQGSVRLGSTGQGWVLCWLSV